MAIKPDSASFKKLSRALVIMLAVVVALAAFNITMPTGKSSASNWDFALSHPTILLHIIAAVILLAAAGMVLVRAVQAGDRSWMAVAACGLAFVLIAFVAGVDYVGTLSKGALDYMSIGWTGAAITYGTGWYLGRRKELRKEPDSFLRHRRSALPRRWPGA
jgi:uncharacterized membrane protein YozB (DUF420 family)